MAKIVSAVRLKKPSGRNPATFLDPLDLLFSRIWSYDCQGSPNRGGPQSFLRGSHVGRLLWGSPLQKVPDNHGICGSLCVCSCCYCIKVHAKVYEENPTETKQPLECRKSPGQRETIHRRPKAEDL